MSTNNEQLTLEELDYFWMSNGAPCFVADRDDICEIVESLGFQIYYLIADLSVEKTVDGKDSTNKPIKYTVENKTASVLKVVNNIIGRSVSVSEDEFGSDVLASVQEQATYNMPKIPKALIDKLDEFFRLIHAQHGTESIVILTFDPTKNDSSGWGVLVPEQENTSVHCKYDADSIAILKPDDVIIVGSVHSHPEMSAYASGTDHADQADFDGIHITYGWQKSVNAGATQYYAEMQHGGSAYKLDIDDVFEDYVSLKDPDPDVVEWSTKVKKVLPPYINTGVTHQSTTALHQASEYTRRTTAGSNSRLAPQIIPFDLPSYDAQVAVEVVFDNNSARCYSCQSLLFMTDVNKGYCPGCEIPIVSSDASLHEIEIIIKEHLYRNAKDVDVAYYLWCKEVDGRDFVIQIKPDGMDSRPSANGTKITVEDITDQDEWDAGVSLLKNDEQISSLFFYNEDVTVCCGVPSVKAWVDCNCSATVYWEDIQDFESAAHNVLLYAPDSICQSCAFYNLPECASYREALITYTIDKELPSKTIDGCDNWIDFTKVANDIDSGLYDYSRISYYE